MEAGTEAAMLEESLEKMIHKDDRHQANHMKRPVFLDSNDLKDLELLKGEVAASHNLVVLLTPNVFRRPWCLIEIVEAVRKGVQIVPVTIIRDGLDFKYPDDEFYKALAAGTYLNRTAEALLKN